MGNLFSSLFGRLKKRDTRVLLLGLDHAGKTTVLSQMGLQEMYTKQQKIKDEQEGIDDIDIQNVVPTVGFNVKEVMFGKLQFVLWDLGGQTNIRQMWKHYYKGTDGVIYVIDSSDHGRIQESKQEIENLLCQEELKECCLLIIANKMDKPNAMSTTELIAKLALEDNIGKSRPWFVQSTCALSGEGLKRALEWFVEKLQQRQTSQ